VRGIAIAAGTKNKKKAVQPALPIKLDLPTNNKVSLMKIPLVVGENFFTTK
jgi:hypothetical protein